MEIAIGLAYREHDEVHDGDELHDMGRLVVALADRRAL